MSRTVAIVGRPNVGKSRLFNRLARKRISIVHDQPGVTRDVISTEIADGAFTLLDTGGLGLKEGEQSQAKLIAASEQQVSFAMDAADLILFVIDGLAGVTALDASIASSLRRSKKKVLLVINKADFGDEKVEIADAYKLGFGEPLRVSAEHGRGESELRAAIQREWQAVAAASPAEMQRFADPVFAPTPARAEASPLEPPLRRHARDEIGLERPDPPAPLAAELTGGADVRVKLELSKGLQAAGVRSASSGHLRALVGFDGTGQRSFRPQVG